MSHQKETTMRTILRRALLAFTLGFGALSLTAGPAAAAGEIVAPRQDTVITVSAMLVTLISGTVIPLVHGLVTKLSASGPVNVIVGMALSAIAGVLGTATVLDGVAIFSSTTLIQAFLAWLAQVAMYARIWKPIGVYDKLLPGQGLG